MEAKKIQTRGLWRKAWLLLWRQSDAIAGESRGFIINRPGPLHIAAATAKARSVVRTPNR